MKPSSFGYIVIVDFQFQKLISNVCYFERRQFRCDLVDIFLFALSMDLITVDGFKNHILRQVSMFFYSSVKFLNKKSVVVLQDFNAIDWRYNILVFFGKYATFSSGKRRCSEYLEPCHFGETSNPNSI